MSIAFLDTEIDPNTHQVLDIGCSLKDGRQFHGNSIAAFTDFLKGAQFVCGDLLPVLWAENNKPVEGEG